MADCRACRANPRASEGLCLVCLKDRAGMPPPSLRRYGPAKGRYARKPTAAERPRHYAKETRRTGS
jgi:hypothetical protein